MTYGTAYFPTITAAVAYYKPYNETASNVRAKVEAGSIHIGKPPTKEGEEAYIVNEQPGRRYYIRDKANGGAK